MIERILDEKIRHALKERAVPGLFWGTTVGGLLTARQLVYGFRITNANEAVIIALVIPLLILFGIIFGTAGTYLWKRVRSQNYLPDEETGKAWRVVPVIFALLGTLGILLLNISTQQYVNQKDLLGALALLILIYDFVLIGMGLGSLAVLGIMWWKGREVATPPTSKNYPMITKAGGSPRRYKRFYYVLGGFIMAVLIAGATSLVLFEGESGNPRATATATMAPIATKTDVVLPSPEIPAPSPPPVLPTPTVLAVPQPPAGAPVAQPTAAATPTRTATVQKPTATQTAPIVCNYTTVTGDTWSLVAAKTGTNLGALMQKNPGVNPAQPGMGLKLPKTGCP